MNHHRIKGQSWDQDTRGKFDTPVMHGTGHKPPKRTNPNSSKVKRWEIVQAVEDFSARMFQKV